MALPIRVARAMVDPVEMLHREMDSVLGRVFGREAEAPSTYWPYAVDVREDADHLYLEAELPGFKKDGVDVTLENQTLTISAERSPENKPGEYLLRERRYGRAVRSFTLPSTVDDRKVDARLADGMLTITLDKREETKPRKITVA